MNDDEMARIAAQLASVLERSRLSWEERVQLAGGLFVAEALNPHWCAGRTPAEAHELLRAGDPDIADAVEALAPLLLSRVMTQAEARDAVQAAEQIMQREEQVGG
ncbi:MAG: hypothetical protein OXC94_10280 [Chloroflexi bacterium]|nr:hypothetical protein [Chloroflexota bacterium]